MKIVKGLVIILMIFATSLSLVLTADCKNKVDSPGQEAKSPAKTAPIRLWKQVDISRFKGTFVTLGDLNNDGRVDFLLSYVGPYSEHLRLIALAHDGKVMWELGDSSVCGHTYYMEKVNPCRPLCTVYDVDGDGRSEVIVEFWNDGQPMLYLLDGATGNIKASVKSPLFASERNFVGRQANRPVAKALILHLNGKDEPISIVLKYSDTDPTIPPRVVAMDTSLNTLWHIRPKPHVMAHHATAADIDGDGRDEIVLGSLAVDGNGRTIFEYDFKTHTDMADVFDVPNGEKRILIGLCGIGPAYCFTPDGRIIWQKSKEDVPHGQGVWAGNFIPDRPGKEVIIMRNGHVGDFITVDAANGEKLAAFQHRAGLYDEEGNRKYPDTPIRINWLASEIQSLWIPIDRNLVDGRGNVIQNLGKYDTAVKEALHCGTKKHHLAVQAIPVDLCGNDREELLLCQPYQGEAIFIFTQPDSDGKPKPYVHSPRVYHYHNYL